MKLIQKVLELVFPSNIYCICCNSYINAEAHYSLCDSCLNKMHWATGRNCNKCGKPLQDTYAGNLCYDCMTRTHSFRQGYTCTAYGLYERAIMMDFKYSGKSYIGSKIGEMMADRMAAEEQVWDMIIPVPIHRNRYHVRGYNQAAMAAVELARRLKIPCKNSLIYRTVNTVPMRSLDIAQRSMNIHGAFSIPEYGRAIIEGRQILLVDDIFTTGSTFDECAATLLDAGAEAVDVISFAAGYNKRITIDDN